MTGTQRVALIYTASILGAAGVAYLRGRTHVTDLATDAIVHGVVAGTALNIVGWLTLSSGQTVPVLEAAKANGAVAGLGKLSAEGIKALSNINVDKLYADMKEAGVKVTPPNGNPNVVVQDAT